MNVVENNKLIAEFMGMIQGKPNESRWKNNWFEKLTVDGNTFESGRRHEYLRFHSDWNWLMVVIEKISKTPTEDGKDFFYPKTFGMLNGFGESMFRFNRNPLFESNSLIEAAFEACVYYIKNYN